MTCSVQPLAEGLNSKTHPLPLPLPPAEVMPYRLPAVSITRPVPGLAPSGALVKLWSTVSVHTPLELESSHTTPSPFVPPPKAVPQRLPLLSKITLEYVGFCPSGQPED